MEFVGRAVAVATADKKLQGSVAKIEEGRLHVTLQSGRTEVLKAEEIVDLQVLSGESADAPRASSSSAGATRAPRTSANGSKAAPKRKETLRSTSASPGHAAPSRQTQPQNGPQRQQPQQSRTQQQGRGQQQQQKQNAREQQPNRGQQQKNREQQHAQQSWDAANGEFDFEASHRQFNKAAVFQSIKDTAVPEPNGQRTVYRADEMVVPTAPRGSRIEAHHASAVRDPAEHRHPVRAQDVAPIPTATALQKVQVQSYMLGQGWSSSAVDESAGRGLAGVCLRYVNSAAPATAVVLAGNHTSGARALAAGRILATRGLRVVAVLVDQVPDQLESQVPAFKASGGAIVNTQKGLFAALEQTGPAAVVVDALQGLERTSLEDQVSGPEQLAASRWLVGWANSQGAARVAVERASTHGDLALQATALVSCGWPLPSEPSSQPAAQPAAQYVVDVGVPPQILQKLGLSQLFVNFGGRLFISVEK